MSDFYNKYPYTDFHELNLDWVIERVKKLTEDWLATQEAWNNTQEQWQQLHDYVMDYFANLDVQDEINNKINQMILDGTFLTIVAPTINQTVVDTTTSWLAAHITQPTTPVVDNTLTIATAAADAFKTGRMTAPAYSSSSTYEPGDLVNHDGSLYRCNTIISTPEAWDGSKWTFTFASAEIKNRFGLKVFTILSYSSDYSDADSFKPANTIFRINNSGTPIAHLPAQLGTLINLNGYTGVNANFDTQIFVDSTNNIYHRYKISGSWSDWRKCADINEVTTLYRLFSIIPNSATQHKIMLIGDSITQGQGSTGFVSYTEEIDGVTYSIRGNGPDYPGAGPGYQTGTYLWADGTRIWYEALDGAGWAQKLKAYWEAKFNCSVLNYGMAGISTNTFGSWMNDIILTSDADIVMIMIGTNDRGVNTLSSFYDNVKYIINRIHNSGKEVVLMSPIPASIANEETPGYNFHMEDIEHVFSKLAIETNCTYINMYDEFLNYCDITGTTIDSLLGDGLHPNDNGYEVMYKIITSATGLNRQRPGATW